jgi:hypothetical protein
MLIEAYEYALAHREELLSGIDREKHFAVMGRARETWHPVEIKESDVRLTGIDSSWNFIPYQGFYLYAVEGVATRNDGEFAVPPAFAVGLDTLTVKIGSEMVTSPALALESIGMDYESELTKASLDKADYVLVDGSVLARYYDRKRQKEGAYYESVRDLLREDNVLFLSKTSYSNVMLDGALGDMFYYNGVSTGQGYSDLRYDPSGVSTSYARLADHSPCVKLEIPGKVDETRLRKLLEMLKHGSVNGYPYVLREAHQRGKISRDELVNLASVLGLAAEIGGREVLGE